jgi:hypothetical protein
MTPCGNCNNPKAATTLRPVDMGGFSGSAKFHLCDKCHRTYERSGIGLQALPGLESSLAMTPMDAN